MSDYQWQRLERSMPSPKAKFVTVGKDYKFFVSAALRQELPKRIEIYTDPENKAIRLQQGTGETGFALTAAGVINVRLPLPSGRYYQADEALVFKLKD